jgi:hypothetical protein
MSDSDSDDESLSEYSSFSDIETDNEENDDQLNDEIYIDSNIKIRDFIFSFMLCCRNINLSKKGINTVLRFIRSILPTGNKIPKTYDSILKKMAVSEKNEKSYCNFCFQASNDPVCSSTSCIEQEKKSKKTYENPAKVYTLDYVNHIEQVVKKNHQIILNYRSKY